ncbi:MAG: hypothetical protein KGL39_07795 [Patescibacteria group bacterium]|nr:hypothetical protein [Patescibacteria group bacterium]
MPKIEVDRSIGLESASDGDGDVPVGRDPRKMQKSELRALGHEAIPVLDAIKYRCLDCCGHNRVEVRRCTAVTCVSWPFRMGTNPWREKRQMSDEEKQRAAERLKRARLAKGDD